LRRRQFKIFKLLPATRLNRKEDDIINKYLILASDNNRDGSIRLGETWGRDSWFHDLIDNTTTSTFTNSQFSDKRILPNKYLKTANNNGHASYNFD